MDGGFGTFRVSEDEFDCSPGLFALLSDESRKQWLDLVAENEVTAHGTVRLKERRPPEKKTAKRRASKKGGGRRNGRRDG